jgi:hypothetical protein
MIFRGIMGDKLDRYPAMILACPAGMEDAGLWGCIYGRHTH